MTSYLSREELRELVGSPLRDRQVAWLTREGWPHAVNSKGRVLVARAYHDRRLGIGSGVAIPERSKPTPLNLDAA